MKEEIEILTKSDKETKKLGEILAKVLSWDVLIKNARVISLEGDLGAGKTTFTQGFAEGLKIKEKIKSPTFVILKIYQVNKNSRSRESVAFHNFIHVDAYRLGAKDFSVFGWQDFIKNSKNIILVEWGNKIKKILPKNSIRIIFEHQKNPKHRLIKFLER